MEIFRGVYSGLYFRVVIVSLLMMQFSCSDKEEIVPTTPCHSVLNDWKITSVPYPNIQGQQDIFFPENYIGYSVGNAGSIMKTTNGGEQWTPIAYHVIPGESYNPNSLTEARLQTVYFLNEFVGFVGGQGEISYFDDDDTDAVFLKTVDGGISWEKTFLEGVREITDLLFFDENNGLGLFYMQEPDSSYRKHLVRSNDGGTTWEKIPLAVSKLRSWEFVFSQSSIWLRATDEAWNSLLLVSSDKGMTWEVRPAPQNECNRLYFITDEVGYATCGLLFFPETVYKTENGGASWTLSEDPIKVESLIHFKSLDQGFVINPIYEWVESGWEAFQVVRAFEVSQTTDGGNTWTKSEISKQCDFVGISHSPASHLLYSVGNTINRFETGN